MELLKIISQGIFNTIIFLSFFLLVLKFSQHSKHRGKKFIPIKKKTTVLCRQRGELDKLFARALSLWVVSVIIGLFLPVPSFTPIYMIAGVNLIVISIVINRSAHFRNQYIFVCETAENMEIVSAGAYAFVRHPFYSAELIKLVGFTLCFRSIIAVPALLFVVLCMYLLTWLEEKELKQDVCEYEEYQNKVKYKFLPFLY